MTKELEKKVFLLAAEVCWMHGNIAGDRICQDWSGEKENINRFTESEKQEIAKIYEQYNSGGADYDPDFTGFHDEMMVSFMMARALEELA